MRPCSAGGGAVFFLTLLIYDITYDLLQNIIHGNKTLRTAIFIHNNGHVCFLLLKVAEQIIQFFCGRYK